MSLSEEAHERLADLVALQPTKNAELQERWGLDSGSEVHRYLEGELKDFYYRNEDSLICATAEAAELVGAEPDEDGARVVQVPTLHAAVVEALPGADEEPASVVSVLHDVREAGLDPEVDDVRAALRSLVDKGVATRVRQAVPTFRLAAPRDTFEVRDIDAEA